MQPTVQAYVQKLEAQRKLYVQLVQAQPAEKVHSSTEKGKWSAAQIIYHLVLVDIQVTQGIEKSLEKRRELKKNGAKSSFRSFLLNLFLNLPLKFKAPKLLGDMPAKVDLDTTVKAWEENRNRLTALLDSFPEEALNKRIFFHPMAGNLNLLQTLSFLHAHAAHHKKQLQNALR